MLQCDEIREIINNDYLQWLSQYLVMKRVSIEFNFHSLYSNFLDCLNNEKLNSLINMETFRNIRVSIYNLFVNMQLTFCIILLYVNK